MQSQDATNFFFDGANLILYFEESPISSNSNSKLFQFHSAYLKFNRPYRIRNGSSFSQKFSAVAKRSDCKFELCANSLRTLHNQRRHIFLIVEALFMDIILNASIMDCFLMSNLSTFFSGLGELCFLWRHRTRKNCTITARCQRSGSFGKTKIS